PHSPTTRPTLSLHDALPILGAGVTLLVAVALLHEALDAQIDHERHREAPSFFFVDVQPDQREAFARVLAQAAGDDVTLTLTPIVDRKSTRLNSSHVSISYAG